MGERSVERSLGETANPLRATALRSFWEDGILCAGGTDSVKFPVPSTFQKLQRDAASETQAEMDKTWLRGLCRGRWPQKDGHQPRLSLEHRLGGQESTASWEERESPRLTSQQVWQNGWAQQI